MARYRVKWEVDVEADNPRQAARRAWALQRGRSANRTRDGRETAVFDVQAPGAAPVRVDFRSEPPSRRRMVLDLPKSATRYGLDKATGLVLAPRSLDMIAREVSSICSKRRNIPPALRAAIEGMVGRPTIAEAMYPDLAVRAARVLLEAIATVTWRSDASRIPRIRAELLDQIEEYERFRAELNRGEAT